MSTDPVVQGYVDLFMLGGQDGYARGFAAGLEQAAGVCDERAEMQVAGPDKWTDAPAGDCRREARKCAAAIRAARRGLA